MALSTKDVQIIAEAVTIALKESLKQSRSAEPRVYENYSKDVSDEVRDYIESAKNTDVKIKDNFKKLTDNIVAKFSESIEEMKEGQKELKSQQENYLRKQEEFKNKQEAFNNKQKETQEKINKRTKEFEDNKTKGEYNNTPELIQEFKKQMAEYGKVLDDNRKTFELEQEAHRKDEINRLKTYDEDAKAANFRIYKKIEEDQKRFSRELTQSIKGAGQAAFKTEFAATKDVSVSLDKYKAALVEQYNSLEADADKRQKLGITDEKMDDLKEELTDSYFDELARQRDKQNLDKKTRVLLEEQYKREKIKAGVTTYEETYGGGSSIAKFAGRMADFTTKRFKNETEKSSIFEKTINAGLGSLFKGKDEKGKYLPTEKTVSVQQKDILNPRATEEKYVEGSESFINKTPEEVKPQEVKPQEVKPEAVKPQEVKPEEVKPKTVKPAEVKPEEVKPQLEPLADKLIKEEAVTTIKESNASSIMKNIQQMLEEAKENVPFKVIISNIEGEGKKSLTDAFSDSLKEALQPLSDKLEKDSKPKDDKNILRGLKKILSRNKKDKQEKEESGSKVPPSLYRRGAAKALEYGAKGYSVMTGGLGISGLLGSSAGSALSGGLGAGAAVTAGGLVLGTAAAAGGIGYGLEQYGGKDEDTGNRKGGAGTFLMERSIGQSKERQSEKIIEESQEEAKVLNLRKDISEADKKIERFKIDLERLQKQKELNKSFGYSLSDNKESIQVDKQIEKLKITIKKLEDRKKTNKDNKEKQTEETLKRDPFLENGKFTAALEGTSEQSILLPEDKQQEVKPKKKPESLFPEDNVTDTINAPTLAKKPESNKDDRFSKKEQTVSKNKDYEKYYKNLYELSGDQVPTDAASIEKLQAEMYKKQTEGHPYSEDNPEFKNDPELWKAVSKNKPTSVYNHEIGSNGKSARLQLTPHPLHTTDAARMGSGMQQSAMEIANSNKGVILGRQSLNGYLNASRNGVYGKNMSAVTEALNESDVNKAKLLVQQDLKDNPGLSDYLPEELLSGGDSKILSKKAEADINKALSDLENTVTPGIGGTDVSNIRGLVSKGDYKTAIKAMEYISKVQGRESLPLDPVTYKDLTGKEMTIKKPAAATIDAEKSNESKKVTSTVSKETSAVTPPKDVESSDNADLEPLLVTNNLQTNQIITLLQDLIKVTAGKNYNPTPIVPINVTQAAPSQNVAQTQSPAWQFRNENRIPA
jgi:hypothetical protein